MGVLAKRVIIHGAINRQSGAETTKLLATTAAIQKGVSRQWDKRARRQWFQSQQARRTFFLIRRVSNIDDGAGNGLAHNLPITALSLGNFR
jgi:hypothetical protein